MSKHRQTKACEFPPKVKKIIFERDGGCCVLCGKPGMPNAHFVPRSHGGLGVEQNGLTLCFDCHYEYDHTANRQEIHERLKAYLQGIYPEWDESKLIYRKY